MYTITIHIYRDGQTKVKVDGYQGPSCLDISRPFLKALGVTVHDQLTTDYFLAPVQTDTQEEVQS